MANASVLDLLYTKRKSALEFNFDNLIAPPLLSLLTPQDIYNLNQIARSVKLSGKIDEKYKLIDQIMRNRGFVKLHAGTNRVVYRFLENQSFVAKIAIDRVGLGDNPAEFRNQFLLKPFVTKIFEVSPCGTIAIAERVDAVMSREEFISIADDVFNLLTKVFIGKYVLEDVGTKYFMNWAIRKNFGPVLLDFPYVYELDGNKLYCNAHPMGRKDIVCGGELDYDDGFNNLICTKCGRHYHARDLEKDEKNQLIIVGGKKNMKVQIMRGNEIIYDNSKKQVAKVIEQPKEEKPKMEVRVNIPKDSIFNKIGEEIENLNNQVDNTINNTRVAAPVVDVNDDLVYHGEDISIPKPLGTAKEEDRTDITHFEFSEIKEAVDDDLNYDDTEDNSEDDDFDYEDDVEEYDQYLSNRERTQDRQKGKQNKRTDYDGF